MLVLDSGFEWTLAEGVGVGQVEGSEGMYYTQGGTAWVRTLRQRVVGSFKLASV